MKSHLFTLFLFCFAAYVHGQTPAWASLFKGKTTLSQTAIADMKTDKEGNIVVAGWYENKVTLNNSPLPLPIGKKTVYYLAKFDTSGQLLWMDTTYTGALYHIEIGASGNYFFSGTSGLLNHLPFGAANLNTENDPGFIGKCDRSGHILWVRRYVSYPTLGNHQNGINDFVLDAQENVFFYGQVLQNPYYVEIGGNRYSYPYSGQIFTVKFDSAGKLVWMKRETASPYGFDYIAMAVDKEGNLFEAIQQNYYPKDTSLIVKYKSDGSIARKFVVDSTQRTAISGGGIVIDPSRNIYFGTYNNKGITWAFNGKIYPNSDGAYEQCLVKLDSDFNTVWVLPKAGGFISYNPKTNFLFLHDYYKKPFEIGGISTKNDPNDTGGYPITKYTENVYFLKLSTDGKPIWIINTTWGTVGYNISLVENTCGDLFVSYTFESTHLQGLNFDFPNTVEAAMIAKFSSDPIGFANWQNPCGISLKNTSNPIYKKFEWFAKLVTDTTESQGKLIATTRDLSWHPPRKGRYIISLQGNKAAGCTNIYKDTFYVPGSPVAGFTSKDTNGCQYVKIKFADTSHADSIIAGKESWTWDFGDQSAPVSYAGTRRPVVSHVYTQSGIYTVKLVYSNGICSDTFISAQKVKIIPAPRPGFVAASSFDNFQKVVKTPTQDTLKGCAPLVADVQDDGQKDVVKWLYKTRLIFRSDSAKNPQPPPAGDSTDQPSFVHSYSVPGTYVIHQYLTGATGCVTEDSAYVRVYPGVGPNDKPTMLRASFDSLNMVHVEWKRMAGAKYYGLYRALGINAPPASIGSGQFISATLDTTYLDATLGPGISVPGIQGTPNFGYPVYIIRSTDSCGNQSAFSDVGRPIILSGQNNDNTYYALNWTPYEKWVNGVFHYDIEIKNPDGVFQTINTRNDTSYKDAQNFFNINLSQCYRIKATEQGGNRQISYSNTLCLPYKPMIFIPNVFTPDQNGLNDTFRIVTTGIKSYTLTIYNRWGEVVYASASSATGPGGSSYPFSGPGGGWDGRFHGAPAEEGVYIYTVSAVAQTHNIYQNGTVRVMR